MKNRLISIIISLSIIFLIYTSIDIEKISQIFLEINVNWSSIGLFMVIPITILTSFRLTWLVPSKHNLKYLESIRLILAASVINMIMPSKMGDVIKSIFMVKNNGMNHAQSLSLVMFEKISDLLALLFWCGFGLFTFQSNQSLFLILTPIVIVGFFFGLLILTYMKFARLFFSFISCISPKNIKEKIKALESGWLEMIIHISRDKVKFGGIMFYSIFLWLLHLSQIWIFIKALNLNVPFLDNLALSPLAIFIGLAPFTIAGIGTRDAAFVFIYSNYFDAEYAAALGIFATMRYIIPALFGIPFLSRYLHLLIKDKKIKKLT